MAGLGGRAEEVPFRECFFVSLRATRKQPTPTPIKKKISEWGRASPTPVRLPPSARPPARSPPGSALLRPEFSSPWIPGSRGRGEEDRGKVWERDGLGFGGRGSSPATPVLLGGPRSSSLRFPPRSLSLPRTFPGQLGLKFSGEAAPSPWDKGRPGSAQDPSRTSPPAAPVGYRARHSAGRRRRRWRLRARGGRRAATGLGSEFSSSRGGGEGPPLALHAATRPWAREARPSPAGPRARPVPRTPGLPARGGGRAEPGVGGGGPCPSPFGPAEACSHLSGTCRELHPNFSLELHLHRRGSNLPTRAPEPRIGSPGPALPALGWGAREPEAPSSAQLSSSRLRASGSPRSRVPEVLRPKDKLNSG